MSGFIAFTKKELTEQIRTYKAFILIAVFFIFGMMSPLTAKLMPDIFANMSIEGMKIIIPTPTYIDAYAQFFKNTTQMGIIIVMLVFSGIIAQEVSKGTLINVLSKGLSRNAVIFSKYFTSVLVWTVSYAIAALTAFCYTVLLFGKHSTENLLFSLFCLWLFGAFVLAVILMSGTLVNGNYGGLLVATVILGGLLIINALPKLSKYNPFRLTSSNVALLTNTVKVSDVAAAVLITVLLTSACMIITLLLFNKKKL